MSFEHPSIPVAKRSYSPPSEMRRPTKRLHLAEFPSDASTLIDMSELDAEHIEVEDMISPAPRRDKGKGKVKPTVELPESVWERIFEFYYDNVCDDWHHTDRLQRGLVPLLLSKDLTSISLPVLYRHPHIGYSNLPSFNRCLPLHPRYSDLTKAEMVRHLTIRPSAPCPIRDLPAPVDKSKLRGIIHPALPETLRPFGDLRSFTLRDTLILSGHDANLLFQALEGISPKKARLEFRMWDLTRTSIGRELVAGSSPNIHAPAIDCTSIPSDLAITDEDGNRVVRTGIGRDWRNGGLTLMQECWMEALLRGGELEFPSWWLGSGGDRDAAGQAPAVQVPAGPGAQPIFAPRTNLPAPGSAQAQAAIQQVTQAMRLASQSVFSSTVPGPEPNALPVPTGLWLVPPRNVSSTIVSTTPSSPATFNPPTDPVPLIDNELPTSRTASSSTVIDAFDHTVPSLSSSSARLQSLGIREAYPTFYREFRAALETHRPQLRARAPPPPAQSQDATASSSSLDVSPPSSSTAAQNRPTQTVPGLSDVQRRRTDHIYTIDDQVDSDVDSNDDDTSLDGYSASPSARTVTLRRRLSMGPATLAPASTNESAVENQPTNTSHVPDLSSYSLAHAMRRRLFVLIEHHWRPELQALCFVALDPLASLIVRSPQLNFWPRISVPHIRVHFPRGIKSLAVFKGAKEVSRDRYRRHNRQSSTTRRNSGIDALLHLHVGGDGAGGDLVHPDNKLFEVEVNTLAEMSDDAWVNCGAQLPPQVCRVLVGEQDWADVRVGPDAQALFPSRGLNDDDQGPPSPSTSGFQSPTFSFASCEDEDEDENMSGDGSEGATYDSEAAAAQKRKMSARGL